MTVIWHVTHVKTRIRHFDVRRNVLCVYQVRIEKKKIKKYAVERPWECFFFNVTL